MTRVRWISSYLFTAVLGLGFAYMVSVSLLSTARSQPGPSDGSLPPEFLNEVNGSASDPTTASPPRPTPPPAAQAPPSPPPPPPINESGNGAVPVPPPPAGASDPAPSFGTSMGTEEYVYEPMGRRDPFRPYRVIRTIETKKGVELEPLQRYDLEQLSVMGVLWDVRQPRALIRDADGNLHTVVKNSKMGRNSGYVSLIREGEIVVVETIEAEGKVLKRPKILVFKK